MWRNMTRRPPSGRLAITTIRGQITKTQVALDAADRRSIAARAGHNDAPVFRTGQSSIGWAQNPAPEQHESLGNVATLCHFVPRKKHVAEIRKPNSPLHLRKESSPPQGPGTTRAKKHTPCTVGCTVGKRAPIPEAQANRRRAVNRAIGQMARLATWSAQAIAALARNAASEPVRLIALRARLKSLSGVFRDQSVKPSTPIMSENRSFRRHDYANWMASIGIAARMSCANCAKYMRNPIPA